MTACVNCARALQPAWKYCIFCGTRTEVAATDPRSRPLPGLASSSTGPRRAPSPVRTPVPEYSGALTAQTPIIPVGAPAALVAAPSDPSVSSEWPESMGERPSLRSALAATEAPTPTPPAVTGLAPDSVTVTRVARAGRVNVLAVLALLLGVLASPLAALFGHVALGQIRANGGRGVIPAWVAIVLGYLWLGFFLVLGITYLATNG